MSNATLLPEIGQVYQSKTTGMKVRVFEVTKGRIDGPHVVPTWVCFSNAGIVCNCPAPAFMNLFELV